MTDFLALPGFYKALFLYIEPITTISPAFVAWIYPGTEWFYYELIPSRGTPSQSSFLDPRTSMAVWQLINCYLLIGLMASFVFRAVRDALPHDAASQERILGGAFTAMAIADVSHIVATYLKLPKEMQYNPAAWNSITHGNISVVVVLFSVRMAWFLGIGRTRYYYGKRSQMNHAKES